jgi:hypothetical protein
MLPVLTVQPAIEVLSLSIQRRQLTDIGDAELETSILKTAAFALEQRPIDVAAAIAKTVDQQDASESIRRLPYRSGTSIYLLGSHVSRSRVPLKPQERFVHMGGRRKDNVKT